MPLLGIAKDMYLSSPNSRAISISSLACILVEQNSLTTCSGKNTSRRESCHITVTNGCTYSTMSIKISRDHKVHSTCSHSLLSWCRPDHSTDQISPYSALNPQLLLQSEVIVQMALRQWSVQMLPAVAEPEWFP